MNKNVLYYDNNNYVMLLIHVFWLWIKICQCIHGEVIVYLGESSSKSLQNPWKCHNILNFYFNVVNEWTVDARSTPHLIWQIRSRLYSLPPTRERCQTLFDVQSHHNVHKICQDFMPVQTFHYHEMKILRWLNIKQIGVISEQQNVIITIIIIFVLKFDK